MSQALFNRTQSHRPSAPARRRGRRARSAARRPADAAARAARRSWTRRAAARAARSRGRRADGDAVARAAPASEPSRRSTRGERNVVAEWWNTSCLYSTVAPYSTCKYENGIDGVVQCSTWSNLGAVSSIRATSIDTFPWPMIATLQPSGRASNSGVNYEWSERKVQYQRLPNHQIQHSTI